MDLNLLDTCVAYFVEGIRPDLASANTCSLASNLARMLDQDNNKVFNIFDVDLCLRSFLGIEPCDTITEICPAGRVYCDSDSVCGKGLYCSPDLHSCERECGLIADRGGDDVEVLDRECVRPLTVCNYDRGRCEPVDPAAVTCQIHDDCPRGAACFLGKCAPKCYRTADCPDTWYCGTDNRCLPRPPASAGADVFEPDAYAVQMTRKNIVLSAVEDRASIPLAIMNLKTKKQEFTNKAVMFGYRLEAKYSRKQDGKCLKDPSEWTPEETNDCLISPEEEFVTLLNPFGTVHAIASNGLDVALNDAAAGRLSPGLYQATVTAYFTNGGFDSATVIYEKTSPSGEYKGRLSVYVDGPNNLLGSSNFSAKLYVKRDERLQWHALLSRENLGIEQDIIDITEGYPVAGYIHGTDTMMFNQPSAVTNVENEIPVKGIYSPHLRRMRLIGVIDIAAAHCRSDNGACSPTPSPEELQVRNVFARKIRRLFQFVGPFDDATHKFHGMYRETIYGLTPDSFTLDGGFELGQSRADETAIVIQAPLLAPESAVAVDFPPTRALLAELDRATGPLDPGGDIQRYCEAAGLGYLYQRAQPGDPAASFETDAAYRAYLASVCAADPSGLSCQGEGADNRIVADLVRFDGQALNALNALQSSGAATNSAILTINDFLRGQIHFCPAPNGESCIDENAVRCGLALHRKAILSGWRWVNLSDLGPVAPDGHELFCGDGSTLSGCRLYPAKYPTIFSLQEHNRFYRELTQTLRYQAGNDLSDAFYVLYRAKAGTVERSEALSEKQQKLFSAWHSYNALQREMFSAVASKVLFAWPMRAFKTKGLALLQQMHAAATDRLDSVAEIIDLKRRLLITADDKDFAFVQHLMQQEYLTQAYLMALQKEWERESFAYEGQGPAALERGDVILAKVNDTRNPLGISPKQIFFENSNLGLTNWKNYRRQIMEGPPSTGLLGEVKTAVETAVANLRGALVDQNTFESQMLHATQQFTQEIDSICGPKMPVNPNAGHCEVPPPEQRELLKSCEGPDCLYQYRCENEACDSVVKAFKTATGDKLTGTSCDLNTQEFPITIGNETRQCVRGQMGNLLQEREQLRLQREQVVRKVNALLRQIAQQSEFIAQTVKEDQDLLDYLEDYKDGMLQASEEIRFAEHMYESASNAASALECLIIVGMAGGSSCLGTYAASIVRGAAASLRDSVVDRAQDARERMSYLKELELTQSSQNAELRRQKMVLDNLTTEVENHIAEYQTVTQLLFNLNVRIDDTYYLAQRAAERYSEQAGQLIDHLVGNESGNVLLRNQYVQRANRRFHELLLATYKMAMAFIHAYNLKGQSEQITNRVFRIMTPEDVEDFVRELDIFEMNYCGGAGIDCDSANNTSHFRFSVREQLFPSLRDIVDAQTGRVLTKGEQFHNVITSQAFMRTRERAGRLVKQIEIPFSIWLNDRGDAGGFVQPWMISPLECNHIIVGNGGGTMAVNVIGTRLRNLTYEIWRGNTDYLRACEPVEVTTSTGAVRQEHPINALIVGYAPQNSLSQEQVPPSYVTHSPGLLSCKNVPESGGNFITNETCFKYFARDRSLAAPDWKLVVPFDVGYNNEWVLGGDRPIIEDIIIYFRYRTRPI